MSSLFILSLQKMCSCPKTQRVLLGWGETCRLCGATTGAGQGCNVVTYQVRSPNRAPYSRRKRFLRLLANTYANRVSRVSKQLTDNLMLCKPRTVDDIYTFLRRSRHRWFKRYDALALLSYHILGVTVKPLSLHQQKWAEYKFRDVQWIHGRDRGTFPAYSWIIEQVLVALGRKDLLQYVHLLKCRHRRAVYTKKYGHVFRNLIARECPARAANL